MILLELRIAKIIHIVMSLQSHNTQSFLIPYLLSSFLFDYSLLIILFLFFFLICTVSFIVPTYSLKTVCRRNRKRTRLGHYIFRQKCSRTVHNTIPMQVDKGLQFRLIAMPLSFAIFFLTLLANNSVSDKLLRGNVEL